MIGTERFWSFLSEALAATPRTIAVDTNALEFIGGGEEMGVNDLEHMRPEVLQVEARDAATETVITLDGELDMSSTKWFGAFLGAVLEKHPTRIAIDAHRLTYVDSSGLRSFLVARASALEAGVGFRIDNPPPQLRRLVERMGLRPLLLDD
jgi:anti-sigma B factor antagonist